MHVRRGDAAIEIDRAALDDVHQLFGANHVGSGCAGFVSLVATGEHGDANGTSGAVWQIDDATNHLISMTRINAQVHRDFNGLVELGDGALLDHRNGFAERVVFVAVNAFIDLLHALCSLGHGLIPSLPGPWSGRSPQP